MTGARVVDPEGCTNADALHEAKCACAMPAPFSPTAAHAEATTSSRGDDMVSTASTFSSTLCDGDAGAQPPLLLQRTCLADLPRIAVLREKHGAGWWFAGAVEEQSIGAGLHYFVQRTDTGEAIATAAIIQHSPSVFEIVNALVLPEYSGMGVFTAIVTAASRVLASANPSQKVRLFIAFKTAETSLISAFQAKGFHPLSGPLDVAYNALLSGCTSCAHRPPVDLEDTCHVPCCCTYLELPRRRWGCLRATLRSDTSPLLISTAVSSECSTPEY